MDHEKKLRDAASALQVAIADAKKAGYAIQWPARPEDLGAMAISETAKVSAPPPPGEEFEHMSKESLVDLATARGHDVAGLSKAKVIDTLRNPPPPQTTV